MSFPAKVSKSSSLFGEITLSSDPGLNLGDNRIRLLELIDELGSLSQAAKAVPMSYRAAWDALNEMNNLASEPLVIRVTGGKNGGGTQLTPYGKQTIALYRAIQSEYDEMFQRVQQLLTRSNQQQAEYLDIDQLRYLLRRISLRSSARNQIVGKVIGLRTSAVDFEVSLDIGNGLTLISVITQESAQTLNLSIGQEIYALVKSSSVMINTDDALKLSPRNQLWGEITRIQLGQVNSEVTLSLPGNKTICAVITTPSVEALNLKEEMQVCAVFEASSVLLCSF